MNKYNFSANCLNINSRKRLHTSSDVTFKQSITTHLYSAANGSSLKKLFESEEAKVLTECCVFLEHAKMALAYRPTLFDVLYDEKSISYSGNVGRKGDRPKG